MKNKTELKENKAVLYCDCTQKKTRGIYATILIQTNEKFELNFILSLKIFQRKYRKTFTNSLHFKEKNVFVWRESNGKPFLSFV